ncbi:Heat shock 70 kDa protein BIP2 [Linum grandiflorum]
MPNPKMTGGGGGGNVIGIDLGTTFSRVAVAPNGNSPETILNDLGNRATPSFVAFSASNSQLLIGESAKNQAAINPRGTAFDVKRLIGKNFTDREVQNDLKYLSYTVVKNRYGNPNIELEVKPGGEVKSFSPEEITAMILGKLKESAESFLGKPVAGAVITVPAYFNDAQRQATKDAGTIAGLNVLRIANEPTAAAVANRLGTTIPGNRKRKNNSSSKILVYDLGGGTLDVTVLEVEDDIFQVLATGCDVHLGGGDFDRNLIDYFVKFINKKHGKDISGDKCALGKLQRECERAKRDLSDKSQVRVEIGGEFPEQLTRAKFEGINIHLFRKTLDVVKKTLEDAKIDTSEIDEILMVGGSTRIPMVRKLLKQMFDGKEVNECVNPDEAVAIGAAVIASNISCQASGKLGVTLCDVTPISLPDDNPVLAKKMISIPFRCKTKGVMELNKMIEARKTGLRIKKKLYDAKFHGLLDLQVEVVNHDLTDLLIESFNPTTRKFNLNGHVLSIEPSDVERVYGLPSTGLEVDVELCTTRAMNTFEAENNVTRNNRKYITLKELKETLEETTDPNAFAKLYIMFSLGQLLVPSNSVKVSMRYAQFLNGSFDDIGKFNWGKHVADTLINGLVELKNTGKTTYPDGDMNFLVLHMMDMLKVEGLHATEHPTCTYWDSELIKSVMKKLRRGSEIVVPAFKKRSEVNSDLEPKLFPWVNEDSGDESEEEIYPEITAKIRKTCNAKDPWVVVTETIRENEQLEMLREVAFKELLDRKAKLDSLESKVVGARIEYEYWEGRLRHVEGLLQKNVVCPRKKKREGWCDSD